MSWNADIAYAFTPFKMFTLPMGIWPLQKYNTFSLVRSIVYCFILTAWMIMIFLEINFGSGNAYVQVDNFEVVISIILGLSKIVSFRLYAKNLTRNFSSAVDDYLTIDTEEKRTIMRRHAYMGRIMCFSILSMAYVASTTFILIPMIPMIAGDTEVQVNVTINDISEFPVAVTFLGEVHVSTSLYMLICMLQYMGLVLTATSNCGNDTFVLAITLHVCGQLELLKIGFSNYGMKKGNENLSMLAARHRYLMENAGLLVDALSFVLLVQILLSCLIYSLMGFQLILALKTLDLVMIMKTTTVTSALMLEMFFYSIVGDYLKCQMEEIAYSIYSCNWYNFPLKLMRNVVFVIMRSQQPVQFVAGRFFVINLESFMTILKSSLSYLSVLRVMVDA
ncbi:odorant receptor 13a-like isoform X1 [Temnothorax longispinosus]|uniref:odorant receptor 13a-like isoform X1 n=1 Tax=Temnothorax longispinosus TaxID=300112 RepID=UPI003A9924DB